MLALLTTGLIIAGEAAAEEETHSLPLPVWAFPAIAAGTLLFLLVIVWSFRSVGKRH